MGRLPRGILKPLEEKSGISGHYISAIIARKKFPSRGRAKKLETAAKAIGKDVPATLWLYGSKTELRAAVAGNA